MVIVITGTETQYTEVDSSVTFAFDVAFQFIHTAEANVKVTIGGEDDTIDTVFYKMLACNLVSQFDAGSTTTWIIVLILAITLAILISRLMPPGGVRSSGVAYTVRPLGSILGGVLGAVNGFLIINLIREYVDGRNLPLHVRTQVRKTVEQR